MQMVRKAICILEKKRNLHGHQKFLALPAALVLALSFSACEGENSVSVSEKTVPSSEEESTVPADSTESDSPTDKQAPAVKLLIDDFEDGDAVSALGDAWYSGTDAGSGGESILEPGSKDAEGHPSPSKTDNGSENYGKYTGISYRYKGGSHIIRIETSDVKDYNYHGKRMNSATEWTPVTLEFSKLAQEDTSVNS